MIQGTLLAEGIDFSKLWSSTVQAGKDLIFKDLPAAAVKTAEQKAVGLVQPVIEKQIQEKASRVASKGEIAAFTTGGLIIGALIAGGSWKRRALAGAGLGVAGALIGWKIGWLADKV
jgi:hypothetical protein